MGTISRLLTRTGRSKRREHILACAAGFTSWVALALALAAIGTLDALTRLLTDHNSFSDGGYVVMALAWLTLAGWAAARGFDKLPTRGPGIRRGWFVAVLLLSALPYSAVAESDLGYVLNGLLVSVTAAFALTRTRGWALPGLLQPHVEVAGLRGGDASARAFAAASDELRARRRFFREAAALTPYVAVEADDQRFFIRTEDKALGSGLFARRARGDMRCLATAVRLLEQAGLTHAGSTFVDVGANIGTTTVAALARHDFARAIALEPAPVNAHTLRLNVLENCLEPVVSVLEVAASNSTGERLLVLSPSSSGKHAVASMLPGAAASTVTVSAVTLDELVAGGVVNPGDVGLLWIDTPRHELKVLAGASVLLDAGVPVVTALRGYRREAAASLLRIFAGYTHFADLRTERRLRTDLDGLLASVGTRTTDLLAIRASGRDRLVLTGGGIGGSPGAPEYY